MGMALYRKYRSKSFSEVLGQEHITKTLQSAIRNKSFSHAYLLTGPRGVGKTSVARIIAHEVNDLPYDSEANHLDIIEIDAASNRRIDEIRELREKIHNAPAASKYKIYIIDEVHMLTKEAFNALLKTLEEPPTHAIFILATTEAHKVPETITSRTQQFHFKPIGSKQISKHLQNIAAKEKISITPDALELIAQHGEGSFRDSIGFLEQAAGLAQNITYDSVLELLGLAPAASINQLIKDAETANIAGIVQSLEELRHKGIRPSQLSKQLTAQYRKLVVENASSPNSQALLALVKKLLDVPLSSDPEVALEVTLVEYALERPETQNNAAAESPQASIAAEPKTSNDAVQTPKKTAVKTKSSESPKRSASNAAQKLGGQELWENILKKIKATHNTLHSFARMANTTYDGATLKLAFQYPFHQKRVNEPAYKSIIAGIAREAAGKDIAIVCEIASTLPDENQSAQKPANETLKSISNIFGGAEVLD